MLQQRVKILFSAHSYLLDKWTKETMWAEAVDVQNGWFRLESIPFYTTGVAWKDVIHAVYSEQEQFLLFEEVVRPSGHSIVQVIVLDAHQDKEAFRKQLHNQGCDSEVFGDAFFVVDIPPNIGYMPIKELLDGWQSQNVIDYAESCLSAVHYYE